jgi:hypothetical protein
MSISSQIVFHDRLVFKGLQVVLLLQGGPQQVGKHPTDLEHVLKQAKVMS